MTGARQQDLSHYTTDYYRRPIAEHWFAKVGLLRPDQLAAVCYIFGLPFFGDEEYFTYGDPVRTPRRVMSIGCGAGDLEAALEQLGVEVLGVDPAPGARALYRGQHLQDGIDGIEGCDTVVFCEALEHLPTPVIAEIWRRLPPREVRVVITNWPAYHPLPISPEGWDHITQLDDDLFDALSFGFTTVLRRGAHLVLAR
jgi:2-polyprenyl-3-methyl-5-hydroxy-6-metoxy-1,4-benzoquinol methylase